MFNKLRARLIDDARQAWRFWSLRLQGLGVGVIALADPLSQALNALPADMRASMPFLQGLGIFLVVAGMLARIVKQKARP